MLILIILIGIILIVFFSYWEPKRNYENSDYYQQTHHSYSSMRSDKGIVGEFSIWANLQKLTGYKKFLFNCYLPKNNGSTTEIDMLLLHESGIYVFESKNFSGWIFGTESRQYWTQVLCRDYGYSQKIHFFNPIIQNKTHLKWLIKYLGKEESLFYSYVVFGNQCVLKDITLTSYQHNVINLYEILPAVTQQAQSVGIKLSIEEIDALYNQLQPLTQIDEAQKLAHIEEVYASRIFNESICPYCRGNLVLRTASKGKKAGEKFWGCANYPQCKYIKKIKP